MPFHVTLAAWYRGEGESLAPEHDVTGDTPQIYELVTGMSKAFGSHWTGGDRRMLVQHAPHCNIEGVLRAGKELEV